MTKVITVFYYFITCIIFMLIVIVNQKNIYIHFMQNKFYYLDPNQCLQMHRQWLILSPQS